jgi:hypothetical protein
MIHRMKMTTEVKGLPEVHLECQVQVLVGGPEEVQDIKSKIMKILGSFAFHAFSSGIIV